MPQKDTSKYSEARRKQWADPTVRSKMIASLKLVAKDDVQRKKISASMKRVLTDPETRLKYSDARKKEWSDPNIRAKRLHGTKPTDASKKKLSLSMKKTLSDPEIRHRYSEARRDQWSKQETRELMRERIKEACCGGFWYGNVTYGTPEYCEKFNKEFKERVRAFWGYKCFECGIPENGRKLHVHHVHYDKKMCCNGSPQDVVPLCQSCHNPTNHNRDYWENHFTELLYANDPDGKCFFTREEMNSFLGGS